jgi:hypothetical protein
MKKLLLLLMAISFTAVSAMATEPLLLDPLSPATVAGTTGATVGTTTTTTTVDGKEVQVSVPGTYTATYDANMVPQNAAAEGKPVPEKKTPRVRIQTKQRSQGNSYWNAGGKGTKSFF